MASRNFLAFDLGAESGRAVLGSLQHGKLTLEERHRFPNPTGRMRGHLYWNLLAQWEELKCGLRKAVSHAGDDRHDAPVEIHGIGVDTWGVDFGLIAPGGEILGNPFHYRDSPAEVMNAVVEQIGREKLFEATGIQLLQFNSLFQLVALRQRSPQILAAAQTLLFVPDLFNYLFTGQRKSEFSIASTSQMYDMRKTAWATELLGSLGLSAGILPEVVAAGTVIGPLREALCQECEVEAVPVIAPGTHDTASAVAAVPAEEGGRGADGDWCYISSGTWSLMGVELDEPIINAKSLKYNYTNEGGVGGKIRFLKNIMGMWLVQECRRYWARHGYDHSYSELTQMAERSPGFEAIVDPNHGPFLAPGEMVPKIEQFCRQTRQKPPLNRGDFVRTCLDSLALTYRRTLEGLEDVTGKKMGVIHIVGGGCQNELLNQMTADATGRPVIAGPVEATAMGNVLTQAMATGDVKGLSHLRQIVRASFAVKRYEPRDAAKWEGMYARYREVVERS